MTVSTRARGRAPATALTLVAVAVLTACGGATGAERTASPASSGSPTASTVDEAGPATSSSSTTTTDPEAPVQIQLTAGDVVLTGRLADNATAAAFAAQLPLTVPISDHADTEKIFYPPTELSTDGAGAGYEPSAGDIAYYSPWGNVVLYYRDFAYSSGLVPMGRWDGDASALADLPDDTELTITLG